MNKMLTFNNVNKMFELFSEQAKFVFELMVYQV